MTLKTDFIFCHYSIIWLFLRKMVWLHITTIYINVLKTKEKYFSSSQHPISYKNENQRLLMCFSLMYILSDLNLADMKLLC